MIYLGYALALIIGVTLGLPGGGGSILTVPILNHVMGMEPQEAIASSLVIVALTSAVTLIPHWRHRRVSFSVGIPFGLASMIGAFAGGWTAQFIPGVILMMIFAIIMVATSVTMIRGSREKTVKEATQPSLLTSLGIGAVVGAITGLVGAGGGFLIVPALVLFGGLPMHLAIGTSLLTIVFKNIAAFGGHVVAVSINWPLILVFAAIAMLGSLLGARWVQKIQPGTLRTGFGWFVLIMGVVVLGAELGPMLL